MEDDLNYFLKKEDDLNFFLMDDNLKKIMQPKTIKRKVSDITLFLPSLLMNRLVTPYIIYSDRQYLAIRLRYVILTKF